MADFSFDEFLGPDKAEKSEPVAQNQDDFSFDDFLGTQEPAPGPAPTPAPQPSAPENVASEVPIMPQKTNEEKFVEKMGGKRPDVNVPTAAITSKEEAKAMGDMNANEVAARSYEQATGADAPNNSILAHIANMGNNLGGRLNANLQMQAAQKLAKGEERTDDETRGLFSKMMFGATKYLGASLLTNDALDEWDDTFGKDIKDPAERTRARNEFVDELARQFIADRTATRQNASTELENREQGFWATVLGKGPEQIGNMLPYMLGPVGIALHFAEEAAAAGTGLANDEYGFAKDGSFGLVAEGDSAGRAALKGVASSGIETATEIVGGKLAGAAAKRVGKVLEPVLAKGGKILVGKFPIIEEVGGKIVQSDVGKAVAKFGGKLKDGFKWMSKKMHWDGLPEENVEELEGAWMNAILGTDKRDSELVNPETGEPSGVGKRFADATKEFFTPKNFIELNEAMLLTMGGGAFVASIAQRGAQKQVDSFLEAKNLMNAEEIKKADLQTKAAAMDAYAKGLSEEQIREKLDTATGLIDRANKWLEKGLDKIAGETESATDKVVTLKNFLTEMDQYNSLTKRAADVDTAANERGEYTKRFTVQTDEKGAPKFQQTIVASPTTGESVTRNEMRDADAGVTVIDTAGAYEVTSNVTGETFRTQSFNRAINAADAMAVLNQQRIAERQTKAQALAGLLANEQYAGRKIEVVESGKMAQQMFGTEANPDAPSFTTADGTTVLVLDNLDNPAEALAAIDVGTPNDRGAFANGVKFETETAQDIDGNVVETKVATDKVHGVSIIDGGDGTFVVIDGKGGYETVSSLEEAVAVANGAKPKPIQPKAETSASAPEGAAARQDTTGENNEAGNVRDEAPAQPEQGGVEGQEPAAPAPEAQRPVEAEPQGGEDSRSEGVVEAPPTEDRAEATAESAGARPAVETGETTPKAEKPVEAASRASVKPSPEEEAKAAKRKAKRKASRQATLERAKAVVAPDFLGKNAGAKETRIKAITDYLADKNHNRASLHAAIQNVRNHVKKHGSLLLSKDDKATIAKAIADAQARLDKMVKADQKAFAERNAVLPKSLVKKYVEDGRQNSLLSYWLENGAFFSRPRSAAAAKKAAGIKNTFIDAKYDGSLFDPDAPGADSFNAFFDGMNNTERSRWLRILFGKDTKEVTIPNTSDADTALASIANWLRGDFRDENQDLDGHLGNLGEVLDAIREEIGRFQEWRSKGAISDEERHYREEQEEEQRTLDEMFGPIDDFRIDELDARGMADLQYANAKAYVENRATAKDLAVLKPSALSTAEVGDKIRIDHHKQTFDFMGYNAENGILYVEDRVEVQTDEGTYLAPETKRFRVTEDGISEIREETNGQRNETGTSDNRALDEKGSATGGSGEESRGGEATRSGERAEGENGRSVGVGNAAGTGAETIRQRDRQGNVGRDVRGVSERTRTDADRVRRLYRVLADYKYAASHPEELKEALDLLKEGVSVSAVANLPLTETDKANWPFVATRINTREDAANLGRILSRPSIESSKVLYLDRDGNILRADIHSVGFVGNTSIDYDQIVQRAPKEAYGVVFMHNHPDQQGNEVTPSDADLNSALKLKQKLESSGLLLLDDMITDHYAFYTVVGKEFTNGRGDAVKLASDGADEFWSRNETRGNSVEKPVDNMKLVPFAERVDLLGAGNEYIKRLASEYAKVNKTDSYIVGIDANGKISYITEIPKNITRESAEDFFRANNTANRFAIMLGSRSFDRETFINGSRVLWDGKDDDTVPAVAYVYSLSGDRMLSDSLTKEGYTRINSRFAGKQPGWSDADVFLPDKTAEKPAAPAAPSRPAAPRITNAPTLTSDAQKAGLDLLDELGGFLKAPVAELEDPNIAKSFPQKITTAEFDLIAKEGGTTDSAREIGFILPDGRMIPYSSHIGIIAPVLASRGIRFSDANGYKMVGTALESGAVRTGGFGKPWMQVGAPLTERQVDRLYDYLEAQRGNGGSFALELRTPDGNFVEAQYSLRVSPSRIVGDIRDFYESGVTPKGQSLLSRLFAPVEPLDREEFRKLRDVAERLMDHLAAHGYGKFDDMMHYVAANRPDVYERLKDPLRRAWNSSPRVVDEADEITFARAREIFGKIDTELQEARNGTAESQLPQQGGARTDGARGDRGRTPSVDPGTDDRTVGTRTGGGEGGRGPRPAAGDGRRGDGADGQLGERGAGRGGRGGNGGDALGSGASVGSDAGTSGEAQRDSEGSVHELNEVTPGFTAYEPPADLPVKAPKSQSLIVEPSALASITPPPIKSKPDIPDSIPENGVLQAHQYHTVCQAVDAHNEMLPDGRRKGYFDGDGTGAGKTRVIAGVILDAMNRKLGGGKALIISKNSELLDSARSDFTPFGISEQLFELDAKGRKRLAQNSKGIAFTTYNSLAQNYAGTDSEGKIHSAGKKGKTDNRFAEIVKWLGKGFDGVIAFDEAHTAAKESDVQGRKQAMLSQAAIDLQNALPNARVLYLTATAAYDAEDLRFLTRMGLWGKGAGFGSFNQFAEAVNNGGLSVMEILTQGMKANGQYCSRSISFKGVNCKREVARVTPEQKQTYGDYASALSQIHDAALRAIGITGARPAQVLRQYFARSLDLFNSLMTAIKIEKAIELGKQAIAEGKSPVFQLISTNEAAKKAKQDGMPKKQSFDLFGNVTGEEAVDDVEVGVKDRVLAYLNGNGFPVREYLGRDENGNAKWGDVLPEAIAVRDEMIALVNSLPDVANPIDALTKAFADVGISRITGGSNKNAEADAFNSGKNLALVFSGAGGTGASYHADKRFKNQRQRVQIPIEFGWEPDKFLQALGRSHRNNQVVPPEFVLLTTDIAGEMRFMSTIANRVAAMGAIVGGDRNSSGQVVSSSDSADNKYGRAAIRDMIRRLGAGQRIGEMPAPEVLETMFLNPDKLDKVEPNQFLGRLQFLPVDVQSAIYGEIAAHAERAIAKAKADGTYDDGIRKIDAKRIVVQSREKMSSGENEGQNRDLLTVSEWYDSRRINHEEVEARAQEGQRVEYVRNKRSGKLYALLNRANGEFTRLAPNGSYETVMPLERGNYETVDKEAGRKEWDEEYAKIPAEEEQVRHYMSGDLIPVWDKIGVEGRPYVYRATPAGSKPFIGLLISDAQMPVTLFSFGKKDEARQFFKDNAYRLVMREGAKFGIGDAHDVSMQPYFKRAKIGTRNVLAVFRAEGNNDILAQDLAASGWESTWAKDETNYQDRGGTVFYREFGEDAEAAFNAIVEKHGVVIKSGKAGFTTRDGLKISESITPGFHEPVPGANARPAPSARTGGRADLPAPNSSGTTLAERVGMPQMRMRVQNGELIITNTDSRRKDDLKLAFGGQWANRVRDGKRYVKSDLRWNKDATGRGGWWSIPLDKVPAEIRTEVERDGLLRAPIAPLESVADMERGGGVARLAQNPDEFKTTFVYNLLRSPVAELEGNKLAPLSEGELIRRAADEGDMTALGELYNRYMKPNAAKGGLKGLISRAAARKGMSGVINDARAEEIASLVWAGTPVGGGYENNRRGIIADFNNGDFGIYKSAKSLIPAMTAKIDRILNDMAERAAKRPEMLTLDKPSSSREGESELDQQFADNPDIRSETAAEFVEPDETAEAAEDLIARKLGDVVGASRRLTPEERHRLDAMDMLDETMFFLPDDLQDVINAVLTEERKRGYTDKGAERVAKASLSAAQKASGLGPRVFGYRYRTAKDLLNEIWNNIRSGKADKNIAIRASEIEGLDETDEELNDEIIQRIKEREPTSDMGLALKLLMDGQATADVADFFEVDSALIRAWKARARNEYGMTFPGDEAENTLGLGDFPERKAVKRGKRGGSVRATGVARPTAWTPDLFAAANATVSDVQADKIADGIAAGAPDEQIARDAEVNPLLVQLSRMRKQTPEQGTLFSPVASLGNSPLRAPVEPLEQGTLGIETDAVEPPYGYTNAAMNEWRAEHGFDEIAKKAKVSLDNLHRQGAAMANNTAEMERMVERLSRAPYAVNPVEQVALGQYIVKMESAYEDKTREKREAAANGNDALAVSLDIEADEILSKLDAAHRINNRVVGNQLGLAMRARQLAVNKDGTLADYMVSCIRAKGGSLTKGERAEAERIYEAFRKAGVEFDEATMQDIVAHIDAISKARFAAQHDEVKERKAKRQVEKIERDYFEALAQIRFHGEKRSGGVLHGLPNGQKWIRALETYHLLNGEGLTDGKPDAAKMVDLVVNDIIGQGVEATAWDVRQIESRMGNLIRPSQDEISKSLRDLHSQMLIVQQTEHMLKTGEMPPKTGFDRDKESAAVRLLRRERDRTMRNLGIEKKSADELIASALDAYKTRLRNQIEDNEKAIADIESGRAYEKKNRRKLDLDEEAQALKAQNDELKKRIAELTHDPAKEQERRVMRAMDALAKTIAVRKEQIAAIQAGTFDFDAKRPKVESDRLKPLRDELKALNEQKAALKKALFPFGTDAEIERRMKMREDAVQKSLDRWNAMAANYEAATSWEERAKAVAPSAKVKFPESDALRNRRKLRDAARAKVAAFRKQLEREDTRGEATRQWVRLLTSAPVLLRTMMDMSVGMVQGGRYMLSHPIKWTKTAHKATKAFLTQKWADQLADEIRNHPYFEDFKAHDGHLYNMEGLDADIPEDFRALETGTPLPGGKTFSIAKFPGIKRSARSFAGFLNKSGLDLYRSMVEACGENGAGATDNVKKDIARFVNIALGYGYNKARDEKGLMKAIMGVMDAMAWAPRKAIAELKYATGYDALVEPWLGTRHHEKSGAEIRRSMKSIGREKLRYLLGSLAFGICGLLLAKAVNGDDDDDLNRLSDILDPRSSDFGRIRIGNTSFSVLAGSEMVWRLLARLVSGQSKVNGIVIDKNRADVVGQYLRGKANPLLGLAWDMATGKDYLGNEMGDKTVGKLVRDYAIPLTWSAEYDNFAMNDPLTAVVNALPVFYGGAKSTYERDPLRRVVAQGDEALRLAKAAAEKGDDATAQRIGERLKEREAVYGAAKDVEKIERKIKQARDKGATDAELADVERKLAEAREEAMKIYRENRQFKWDDMGWAE